ncbi:MAG: hypothetical protein Kilf2KO_15690 [Rhodospirillales bacterium]
MARLRPSRRQAVLSLLAVGVSGCSLFESGDVRCPPITILPDAARLIRYSGGTDLTDVRYEANIDQVSPLCERTDKGLKIDLTVVLSARRGPALPEGNADFSYFVAVTSADRRLLARQEFPVSIPLGPQGRRVRLTELVQPLLPLTETQSQFGYQLFIGLVLTRGELQRNRS